MVASVVSKARHERNYILEFLCRVEFFEDSQFKEGFHLSELTHKNFEGKTTF